MIVAVLLESGTVTRVFKIVETEAGAIGISEGIEATKSGKEAEEAVLDMKVVEFRSEIEDE